MKHVKAIHHEGAATSNQYQRSEKDITVYGTNSKRVAFAWTVDHGFHGSTSHLLMTDPESVGDLAVLAAAQLDSRGKMAVIKEICGTAMMDTDDVLQAILALRNSRPVALSVPAITKFLVEAEIEREVKKEVNRRDREARKLAQEAEEKAAAEVAEEPAAPVLSIIPSQKIHGS